jgi:hypothetical protein
MKNRSAPPCEVIPVVAYPDVAAADIWLSVRPPPTGFSLLQCCPGLFR